MSFIRRNLLIVAASLFLLGILFTRFLPFALCVVFTAIALSAAIFLLYLKIRKHRNILPFLLCFVLFLALLLGTCNRIPERQLLKYSKEEIPVTVTVRKTLYESQTGTAAEAWLTRANGEKVSATVRIILPEGTRVAPGSILTGSAKVSLPSTYASSDSARYAASLGQVAFLYMKDDVKEEGRKTSLILIADSLNRHLCERVRGAVPGESGEVICALLLGEQSGLSPAFKRDMTRIGTAHMLALSGMNVNLLILGLYHLLQCMKVHKKICYIFLIPLTFAYMALTGFSASVLRAGFMTVFMLFAFLCGRAHYGFSALFMSVAVICAFTPYAVLNMSLWLSAASTLGILLFVSRLEGSKKKGVLAATGRTLLLSLGITVAACAATLPLTAYLFGTFPLMSLPANLVLSPVMDLTLYLGVLVILPLRFPPLYFLAEWVGKAAVRLAAFFSAVPHTQVSIAKPPLFFTAIAVSLSLLLYAATHPRGRFRKKVPFSLLGIFLGMCVLFHAGEAFVYRNTLRIDSLSVSEGQADFLLLREAGYTAMIDVSTSAKSTVRRAFDKMNECYRHEVDAYIFTDYRDGLPNTVYYLSQNEIVRSFYLPEPQNGKEEALLSSIRKTATKSAIPVLLYSPEEPVFPGRFTFIPHKRMAKQNDATSSVCFSLESGGKRLTYCSASCFTSLPLSGIYRSYLEGNDYLLFGGYGGGGKIYNVRCSLAPGTRVFCADPENFPLLLPNAVKKENGYGTLPSMPLS